MYGDEGQDVGVLVSVFRRKVEASKWLYEMEETKQSGARLQGRRHNGGDCNDAVRNGVHDTYVVRVKGGGVAARVEASHDDFPGLLQEWTFHEGPIYGVWASYLLRRTGPRVWWFVGMYVDFNRSYVRLHPLQASGIG